MKKNKIDERDKIIEFLVKENRELRENIERADAIINDLQRRISIFKSQLDKSLTTQDLIALENNNRGTTSWNMVIKK